MSNENRPVLEYRSPGRGRRPSRRWRWVFVTIGLAVVAAVAASLLQPKLSSRPVSNAGRDRFNLMDIGGGIDQFCRNHGGRYPATFAELMWAEREIDADTLVCPGSTDTPITWPASSSGAASPTTQAIAAALAVPGHLSYAYVGRADWVAGRVPADAVVAYESPAHFANGHFVLFANGTVDMVPMPRAARLIAAASATTRPVSAATVP